MTFNLDDDNRAAHRHHVEDRLHAMEKRGEQATPEYQAMKHEYDLLRPYWRKCDPKERAVAAYREAMEREPAEMTLFANP